MDTRGQKNNINVTFKETMTPHRANLQIESNIFHLVLVFITDEVASYTESFVDYNGFCKVTLQVAALVGNQCPDA